MVLKFYYKVTHSLSITGLCYFLGSFSAQAMTVVDYPVWSGGGGIAGICYYNFPDLAPLSVTRTLVVDNHLPVGTELFRWGYNEFAPNVNSYCNPNGTNFFSASSGARIMLASSTFPDANGAFATSIPGIGIKYYFTFTSKGYSSWNSGTTAVIYSTRTSDGISPSVISPPQPLNIEYQLRHPYGLSTYFNTNRSNGPVGAYYFSQQANHVNYSIRAILVKTGNITYTSAPLSFPYTPFLMTMMTSSLPQTALPNLIGAGGITIIPPACRLKTPTDYNINMGRWLHGGPGTLQPGMSLPANGPAKPVNISLECSGKLDNVYFRLEDAGASPLANKNVSLYDSGGTKIDGLEIEMLYSGNRINVDNSTKTNVGVQGTVKTNPADVSFNIQSTIPFTARYVQRNAIQKGGVSYTGAITGRVNMYVIYQ